jgi:hypothetical protein
MSKQPSDTSKCEHIAYRLRSHPHNTLRMYWPISTSFRRRGFFFFAFEFCLKHAVTPALQAQSLFDSAKSRGMNINQVCHCSAKASATSPRPSSPVVDTVFGL